MTTAQLLLALVPLAYVVGSIPFGLLVGKAKGIDVRTVGSKNIGATNVGRVLGARFFWIVFTLDLLKGMLPCLVAGACIGFSPADRTTYLLWMLVGLAAILGHMFSVFLKFQGGKGVSTSAGVLLGIWPYFTLPGLVGIAVWAVVFLAFRYVSAASMVGAVAFPIVYAIFGLARHWPILTDQSPLLATAILLALLIVYKHRANISRLLAGTENKVMKRE
jgi:acyl phosphate:glycerol-3-phosphate acyltransferase